MGFHLIHQSIIDLYINALTLHVLQERFDKQEKGLDTDIQIQIDEAASAFVISANNAEAIFGNPDLVQEQLNVFTNQRQGSA